MFLPRVLQAATDAALQCAFPPVCFSCNMPLPSWRERICRNCLSALRVVAVTDEIYRRALHRLQSAGVLDLIVPWYFEKEGPLQSLIHQLKYGGMTRLGFDLGKGVGDLVASREEKGFDAIIPIPLHKARMRERGYNQAACIAAGVARITRRPVRPRLVRRSRFTPTQTALSFEERQENVLGAFAASRMRLWAIAGRRFLLVDDVVTTGATMGACSMALLAAGAREVVGCAIAIAE